MAKWRCDVCCYVHEDIGPPVKCPKCGADIDNFYDQGEESKLSSILEEDFEEEEELHIAS